MEPTFTVLWWISPITWQARNPRQSSSHWMASKTNQ
jgi:hypothetical protein